MYLTSNDYEEINSYISKFGEDSIIKKIKKNVLKHARIYEIMDFVSNVKLLNFKDFQKAVISSNEARYIYKFLSFPGVNRELLLKALIKTKDARFIYLAALSEFNTNSDILLLKKAIIKTKDQTYMKKFNEEVKVSDKKELNDKINDILDKTERETISQSIINFK